jgi:hypothetical protein
LAFVVENLFEQADHCELTYIPPEASGLVRIDFFEGSYLVSREGTLVRLSWLGTLADDLVSEDFARSFDEFL